MGKGEGGEEDALILACLGPGEAGYTTLSLVPFPKFRLVKVSQADFPLICQSKRHNFVGRFTPEITSASCGNHYKLFAALLSHKRHWRRVRARGQLCHP